MYKYQTGKQLPPYPQPSISSSSHMTQCCSRWSMCPPPPHILHSHTVRSVVVATLRSICMCVCVCQLGRSYHSREWFTLHQYNTPSRTIHTSETCCSYFQTILQTSIVTKRQIWIQLEEELLDVTFVWYVETEPLVVTMAWSVARDARASLRDP